jgi:hypothetical protein
LPNATDSVYNRSAPWRIKKCSINTDLYLNDTLNQPIYVHMNTWTPFDSEGQDGRSAVGCFNGLPGAYFNNTVECNFEGDIGYVGSMTSGETIQSAERCHDDIDNGLTTAGIDCDATSCQGIPYFTCPNATSYFDEHPFIPGFTSLGGFSAKEFGIQAADCSAAGSTNLCKGTFSVGGRTFRYHYTKNTKSQGTLKVRYFYDSSISTGSYSSFFLSQIVNGQWTGFSSYKNPSTSIFYPYKTSYQYTVIEYADTDGFSGRPDQVIYINLSGASGTGSFRVYADIGADKGYEDGVSFSYGSGPNTWDEADTAGGLGSTTTQFIQGNDTSDNVCNDDEDNDLDYYSDCTDLDCDTKQVGVTAGTADPITCEHDGVQDYSHNGETTCWDGFDNDGDGDVDCADNDCNGSIGAYYAGSIPVKYNTSSGNVAYCENNNLSAML